MNDEIEKLLRRPFHYTVDKRGTPIPVHTYREDGSYDRDALLGWAAWMEDIENRRVLVTEARPGVFVSTVFLGIDHGIGPVPVLWETMVYTEHENRRPTWWDVQRRYRSEASARDGHAEVVREVQRRVDGA